jgi:fluoride exporter
VSPLVVIAIGLVGGLGATGRFLLDGAVSRRVGRSLPWGTLAVNLTGAFALGVLAGATISADAYRIAGVGFLGAYTTFSTWMLESHRLAEDGRLRLGIVNLLASLAAGVAVAWLGQKVGGAL